ncbi:uncharacterized protein [Cicer arietinum]|uniref:Uncharacterized protein LOC101500946 n=1 Tax=Cicer arietinum TaxID=3827 RepID=A0A1S2XVN4_CICAR|nr:uncharacterized protein LOC101500946 [Cicer arietinum]XP_004495190.1 uncharacterized protein LOC101501474 [Cicer arietinum]
METLVVVDQHKNQYCSRSKSQGHGRFGSSPSKQFRGINCRTFQSDSGILPTPLKSQSFHETKTPTSPVTENPNRKKTSPKSSPIPINGKTCRKETTFSGDLCCGSFLLSELWAGPTYSNSPPPSSLPIPKFSVRPKRTVSLDLPDSSPEIELRPMAKSAPSSPTRERLCFTRDLFVNADSATETLRRILNLDINDE